MEKLFRSLGLDLSTALNMFLTQAVREQGLPIRPTLNVPNRVTAEAIAHTERILAGEIADDGATFDNAAEAIEYLDNVK